MKKYTTRDIPIKNIDLDDHTFRFRQMFFKNDIDNLKKSIRENGLLNPISVRKKLDGYQPIAGWRRIQAVFELGNDRIKANVYTDLSDEDALRINIADNHNHVDFNEVEIAYLVRHLRDEKGLTVEKIAEIMHFNTQRVYNLLMLSELESEIQDKVAEGSLSLSHVVELSRFPESTRLEYMWRVVEEGWSVRQLKDERKKYSHPFLGKWTDEVVKKHMRVWHAVRFVRNPQVDEVFTRAWGLLQWENMPTPYKCEFTRTIPATKAEPPYICPNDIEWVVTNPQQKRRPLEKRDAWFFLCRFCAETVFPGIHFHEITWEPPFQRIQEDSYEQPIITIKKKSTLREYNYMLR